MSSIKKLKKDINNSVAILFTDLIMYKLYIASANAEAADKSIGELIDLQNEFLSRANAREGKNAKKRMKLYFQSLKNDFRKEIDSIAKEIEKLP